MGFIFQEVLFSKFYYLYIYFARRMNTWVRKVASIGLKKLLHRSTVHACMDLEGGPDPLWKITNI